MTYYIFTDCGYTGFQGQPYASKLAKRHEPGNVSLSSSSP